MTSSLMSLFDIQIDFDQSHLFFPRLVIYLLVLVGGLILVVHGRGWLVRAGQSDMRWSLFIENADKLRFFGTLVLVAVYFWSMNAVGELFPNTGMGFLLTSIPFMLLMSLLYVHGLTRRVLVGIVLNSLIAPLAAWYLLGQLFAITLP